jgi:hypothetical protein
MRDCGRPVELWNRDRWKLRQSDTDRWNHGRRWGRIDLGPHCTGDRRRVGQRKRE